MYYRLLLLPLLYLCTLYAERIETFYGPIDVEEPILLELLHSPALQRLKAIHQYGIAYYTTHPEEYNRFDHSVGVFAILKIKGASLEEQVTGLLHDVSHTVFSHVGDWVFGKEHQEIDYQTTIQRLYLATCGIEPILHKHGFTVEQVLPKKECFKMLEQPLPNLCADRIDYNLQGAFFQRFLTKEEAKELLDDLHFVDGRWVTTKIELAAQLMRFSLFMTEDCWGSAVNHVTSRALSRAIVRGLNTGLLSWHAFHFGSDDEVWNTLCASSDPVIQENMVLLFCPETYYELTEPEQADVCLKFRCRVVDPWILHGGEVVRLTALDTGLAEALEQLRQKAQRGWPIRFKHCVVP